MVVAAPCGVEEVGSLGYNGGYSEPNSGDEEDGAVLAMVRPLPLEVSNA